MPHTAGKRKKFIISIESCRNATWQGRLVDVDGQGEVPFRSVLEMLKLMDSAIEKKQG